MLSLLIAVALACPPSTAAYLSIDADSNCLAFPQDRNLWDGSGFGTYYGTYGSFPDPDDHWVTSMALEIENTCADTVMVREPGCTDCFFDLDIVAGATVVVDVPEPAELDRVRYELEVSTGTTAVDITVTAVGGETVPCGTADTGPTSPADTDADTDADSDTDTDVDTDDTGLVETDTGEASSATACGCAVPRGRGWALGWLQRPR